MRRALQIMTTHLSSVQRQFINLTQPIIDYPQKQAHGLTDSQAHP